MLKRLRDYFRSDLAVDLGTANTLVGIVGKGVVLDEPSVVAVDRRTQRILSGGCAVGQLARQLSGRTPDSIAVVRPLASGVIADFVLCEAMLRYFLGKAQRSGLRRKPRVLVTVPGCITPVEKRAVYGSFHRAGARRVLLIREAMAAAIGAGLPVAEPVASMVCDIGGGTTEIAVLSMADLVASHSIRTGGDRMDQAVGEYLRRHYSLRIGLGAAESLRIGIGSAVALEEERCDEVRGVDAISGLPRKATITSEEVREALAGPLEEILDAIKTTLDQSPPDLAADLLDNGLVLCGGGSLVPGLDRYLAGQTGLPVRVCPDPQTAVIQGALVCLEHLDQWRPVLEDSEDDF